MQCQTGHGDALHVGELIVGKGISVSTTAVTKRRICTLMHDPVYRAQVSFEQSAYDQPPHAGFHIGAGMADPPVSDIRVVPR